MEPIETYSQSTPPPSQSTPPPPSQFAQNAPPPPLDPSLKKRRRPSSVIYNEKLLDRLIHRQISRSTSSLHPAPNLTTSTPSPSLASSSTLSSRKRSNPPSSPSSATPPPSPTTSTYETTSSPSLCLNPHSLLTEDQAAAFIRSDHRRLVSTAYSFLLSHAYINFSVLPSGSTKSTTSTYENHVLSLFCLNPHS